jgi:hypothetical protein
MKKILLVSSIVLSSLAAKAQGFEIYEGTSSTTDISGSVIEFNENGTTSFEKTFSVKNTTGAPIGVKIRRVQVLSPNSYVDEQICWGTIPDPMFEGTCIDFNSTNTNWISPNTSVITSENEGELKIKITPNSTSGSMQFRYYIEGVDANKTKYDSIDVKIISPLAVKEVKNSILVNTFPNPANDFLTVQVKGLQNESTVKITDVLGNLIIEEKFLAQRKFDVSELKNGVYIVTVYNNGSMIQNRRIVVKR